MGGGGGGGGGGGAGGGGEGGARQAGAYAMAVRGGGVGRVRQARTWNGDAGPSNWMPVGPSTRPWGTTRKRYWTPPGRLTWMDVAEPAAVRIEAAVQVEPSGEV